MTDDTRVGQRSTALTGLVLAAISAVSFSLSGSLAKGLFGSGWSTGGVLLMRMGLGAILLAPFAIATLRGRWRVVRRSLRLIIVYSALAVGGVQFAFFSAVQHMEVGPALLIEYTAPAVVVLWLWWRHGERPGRLTVLGAVLAAVGLVLVLDLLSGADLSTVGVAWALAGMVGCAAYFVLNADDSTGLPPLALAWLGLLLSTLALGVLALLGLIPATMSTADSHYADAALPWWLPVLLLGAVTSALAYGTGVAAARRLGSRLASFVALFEVVSGVVFAWLFLGEIPGVVQLLGGLLILAGVIVVRLGEPRSSGV